MDAIIDISPIAAELEATRTAVFPHEFSGFGIVEPGKTPDGKTSFMVSKWFLLDVGSSVLTTISIEDQLHLKDYPDVKFMRCWIHAHPIGNGIPGPHNWSATDNNAITKSPMGTVPALMPWMIAVVRTPQGWVGRFDVPGKQTDHLEVKPSFYGTVKAATYLRELYDKALGNTAKTIFPPLSRIPRNARQETLGFMQYYDDDDPYYDDKEEFYDGGREFSNEEFGTIRPAKDKSKNSGGWWDRFLDDNNSG